MCWRGFAEVFLGFCKVFYRISLGGISVGIPGSSYGSPDFVKEI